MMKKPNNVFPLSFSGDFCSQGRIRDGIRTRRPNPGTRDAREDRRSQAHDRPRQQDGRPHRQLGRQKVQLPNKLA